ncbi:hypothetical protein Tco_0562056 [Tanacetum coccineum]
MNFTITLSRLAENLLEVRFLPTKNIGFCSRSIIWPKAAASLIRPTPPKTLGLLRAYSPRHPRRNELATYCTSRRATGMQSSKGSNGGVKIHLDISVNGQLDNTILRFNSSNRMEQRIGEGSVEKVCTMSNRGGYVLRR